MLNNKKRTAYKTKKSLSVTTKASSEVSILAMVFLDPSHRVLRPLFTYQKNSRTVKHAFFGAKPHGKQRLLKAFCPLWESLANVFEKKRLGYLVKILNGGR